MILNTTFLYAQYNEIEFETDSSEINIVKNSLYKIYKETYKDKDSVWYSVRFIKDTTRLHTEGWHTKSFKYLGIWEEYDFDGNLKYTRDYDNGTCIVNKELYPFHDLLESMKNKADSLILNTYSKDFYDNHLKFEFDCYAYHGHLITLGDETFWTKDYLGSWTEPIKSKPNSFKFRYEVRLSPNDKESIELGIDLDSLGNYEPSKDDTWNNYGFEDVRGQKKTFLIDTNQAFLIAKQNGLIDNDTSIINKFLIWENFKKRTFFNGQFRYYITEFTGKTEYTEETDRKGVISRYNVYSFNPWTGEFIEVKKMWARREWGENSGHYTGLREYKDK